MRLTDVSDRQTDNPYSASDAKMPPATKTVPIATDELVSKIVGHAIKGDDKRLIRFVVELKRTYGPEAPVQYLLNTDKNVQEMLKAALV